MNVSKQWIQQFLDFPLPADDELVQKIGAQLGGVESYESIGERYIGAVIVKVVECNKLENSDHLNVCYVDDGGVTQNTERREDGLVQVVCGAPNVAAGATVVWLPPGSTVPSTYGKEPFVLEARPLRGVVSNGMLASSKELAIGDNHEGLFLLDSNDAAPGTTFVDAFQLNDTIIDIENKMFTHRPDCFGQLGVAREVAGIFGKQFTSPDWYSSPLPIAEGQGLSLTVTNQAGSDVPRIIAVACEGISVGTSPVWLQTYLSRVGIRPINNVVDATNYFMMLTGQPLHAYDYDKVAARTTTDGAVINARLADGVEQLKLLNGKTITPRKNAILITTDSQAIGLGGAMGGADTEVDSTTTRIILESASFDMYSVRRTSMAHGIFSDAVTRFNKGQSPLQNRVVLAAASQMLTEIAGATVASAVCDVSNELPKPAAVLIATDFINSRLGLQLDADQMTQLLTNVEFQIEQVETGLKVTAPFWRTDIAQPEDVVEEIGRLYGFDKLPLELPLRSIQPGLQDAALLQKDRLRQALSKAGANEVLTYSFVNASLLQKAGQSTDQAYELTNALSPDLQYYRYNALPSLLDQVHLNSKAGYSEFALFELSKGHMTTSIDDNGLPQELELLDLVYTSKLPQSGAAFYKARRYLDALATALKLQFVYKPISEVPQQPILASYDVTRTAVVLTDNNIQIGYVGEFKTSVRTAFKLPAQSAGFSIDRTQLHEASRHGSNTYHQLPKYPKVEQDICLRTNIQVSYAQLHENVTQSLEQHKPDLAVSTLSLLDIYQRDGDARQTTFRISLAHFQKTMTDQEMSALLQAVADQAAQALGAERI